jgi:ATPase family protein associated with various cellular activities (AAA)
MEHFSVVQSLCRIGLEGADPRFRTQVERLRQRLSKDGADREVQVLERLLSETTSTDKLAPSVVEVSRSLVTGDHLTANVHPPVDKETSVPLAELILDPQQGRISPIYSEVFKTALDAFVAEWHAADELRKLGVEPSRTCLIYGPPGTGKTLTAFTIASRLRLPVVNARIDGLVSSFLGTSARNISNLFDFANRYRCVLILDEFDAVAKMRDDPHEVGEIKRVVNTLLQNLDARANLGLTIAITNHDGLLDPAVWRRFENHIHLDLPDSETRLRMLETFLLPLQIDADMAKVLAFVVGNRSGSQLRTFCDALKRAIAQRRDIQNSEGILEATRSIVLRLGLDEGPAHLLVIDTPAFVGAALNDSGLAIRQEGLAQIFGCSQSTISRYSQEWLSSKHDVGEERRHA